MSVVVDTSIWTLSLRRPADRLSADEQLHVDELAGLIRDQQVLLIGPVRQETLSGIRDAQVFDRIRLTLRAFPDEPLSMEDYEEAATAWNICRAAGTSGSTVDFLLCAAALRRDAEIYTTDADFILYARHLPLRLH